jgi:hypothetical protein
MVSMAGPLSPEPDLEHDVEPAVHLVIRLEIVTRQERGELPRAGR